MLELANYHILGRILYYVPYLSPIHPGRVLSTFALLSAIVEALNGWGASYTANASLTHAEQQAGHILMKASLVIQLFVIACFLTLAGLFHRRCRRAGLHRARGVRQPLLTLYVSVTLILARTIYRLIEHFGFSEVDWHRLEDPREVATVIRYEWFFYVFEASLMLANMTMWNARHPGRYLPSGHSSYLARDGVTEVEGVGWEDPRPFVWTVLDPFDIGGIFRRKSRQVGNKFEDGNSVVVGRTAKEAAKGDSNGVV